MVFFPVKMACSGLAGPSASVTVGMAFGVAPVIKFGNAQLQERFLPDLLTGRKRTCIAITEPDAGSDVANITTTAIKTKDGKHYIINGTKKWYAITLFSRTRNWLICIGSPMVSGPIIRLWPSEQVDLDPVASP